jgi:putative membrane protein
MLKTLSALALGAVLALPALAQQKMDNDEMAAFKRIYQANINEVAAGKVGAEKAQSPDVKRFAQKMVDDHGKMAAEMKTLGQSKGVNLAEGTGMTDMAKLKLMERKSGAEFDQAFMDHMVKEHELTAKDVEATASKAKDAEFKAALQKALPKIKEHLAEAKRLQQTAAAGGTRK